LFQYLKHDHTTVAITASEGLQLACLPRCLFLTNLDAALFACFKHYNITTTVIPAGLSTEKQAVYKFLATKLKTYRQKLLLDLSHRDDEVAVRAWPHPVALPNRSPRPCAAPSRCTTCKLLLK